MATAIRLEVFPARQGDCLLVECLREGQRPWRMLVDGGPPDTWPRLEARLRALPDPAIDVAVCTHIDNDHIGGFIPFLLSDLADHVGDVWFNGYRHVHQPSAELRSIAQGETVTRVLLGQMPGPRGDRTLPWNEAFDGAAVTSGKKREVREVPLGDGAPRITVLSPSTARLTSLGTSWVEVLELVARGEEDEADELEVPPPLVDLETVAAPDDRTRDSSVPNGSSIVLLLEHRGASLLLGADGFGSVLGASLTGLAEQRGLDRVEVDVFKLPHHGSRGNVFPSLLAMAPARHYVFSSNGDIFRHPDDAAVARTVLARPPAASAPDGPELWFNYRTDRTERWADPALAERYRFVAHLPGDGVAGCVLEVPEPGTREPDAPEPEPEPEREPEPDAPDRDPGAPRPGAPGLRAPGAGVSG